MKLRYKYSTLVFCAILSISFVFYSPQKVEAENCGGVSDFSSQYIIDNKYSIIDGRGVSFANNNGERAVPKMTDSGVVYWTSYKNCPSVAGITTVKLITPLGNYIVATSTAYAKLTYAFGGTYEWRNPTNPAEQLYPFPYCPTGYYEDPFAGCSSLTNIPRIVPFVCGSYECRGRSYAGNGFTVLNPNYSGIKVAPDVDTGGLAAGVGIPVVKSIPILSTDIKVQDAVIEKISATGKMDFLMEGPAGSRTYSVPATNCVRIAGLDPVEYAASHGGKQPIKVVFMRGKSMGVSADRYLTGTKNYISAFNSTDPFMTYSNEFSFYIDLKNHDDSAWISEVIAKYEYASVGQQRNYYNSLTSHSSCTDGSLYFLSMDITGSWTPTQAVLGFTTPFSKMVILSTKIPQDFNVNNAFFTAVHEAGHSLAGLADESLITPGTAMDAGYQVAPKTLQEFERDVNLFGKNCVSKPLISFRNTIDNNIYGGYLGPAATLFAGCRVDNLEDETTRNLIDPNNPQVGYSFFSKHVYRPSMDSLMNYGDEHRFNVISCGYIMAAIQGDIVTKENAQKYWPAWWTDSKGVKHPGCGPKLYDDGKPLKDLIQGPMKTIISGIPLPSPTPIITPPKTAFLFSASSLANIFDAVKSLFQQTISIPTAFSAGVYRASPGFQVKISGSGFTATGNAAQFKNTSTGAIFEILDIPNTAGSPLTFSIPTSTPPGEYMMKVGAFNSPWSNELSFSVLPQKIPVITISAYPVTVKSGQSTTVEWTSDGADSCTGTTNASVPSSWTNPGIKGTMTFVPKGNTTLTLLCTGFGGTKSVQTQIFIDATSKPTVTLTATPSNISSGNGTTLSWTGYNATSCTGSSTSAISTWNKSQLTSGSLYVTPTESSTFTLSCTGPLGITTVAQSVTVANTNNLSASCSVTPSATVGKNQLATRTAFSTGGTGTYTYSWTGAEGLIGSSKSISTYYSTSGSKIASVTVASGGQTVTTQCPISVSSSFGPVNSYTPSISRITPTAGYTGTKITIDGYGYTDGVTMIIVKNGGDKLYLKPIITTFSSLTVDFDYPVFTKAGNVSAANEYSISVLNHTGLSSGGVTYTSVPRESSSLMFIRMFSPPISILVPTLVQISPLLGLVGTTVTISGINFNSESVVTAKQGNYIATFAPTTVSTTFLTFILASNSIISGDVALSVSNKGISSNELKFTITTPAIRPPEPSPATSTPPRTPTPRSTPTISIITRLNGRALTTAEAGSCYTNFYSPYFSSTNIGSCTRTLTDADTMRIANMHLNVGDTYQVDWKGGYPAGADTLKNPIVTPKQVLTTTGSTFYLDFVEKPVSFPASSTPITVLPMSQTMPVQPGSMLNYGLNWAGGPLNQPDADAWKIFVHLERQGGGATIAGDFFPTLLLSKWTSNARGFSTFSSILIPEDTQLGIYNVYVGIYRGPNRQALIPGSGVIAENGGTSKRYLVGTVQIGDQVTKNVNQNNTAAIQQTGANSLWNVVKRWFGF